MLRTGPVGILLALLLAVTFVVPLGSAASATTHPYTIGANVGAGGQDMEGPLLCANDCLGGAGPSAACCVGGFFFTFPSDVVSLRADDAIWGSHVGLMVCVHNPYGGYCGGAHQAGPVCGPMTVLVFGSVPAQGVAYVFTALVEEDLTLCGATHGTVAIEDVR